MLTVIRKRSKPPGGWHYVDPDTGKKTKGQTLEILVKKARTHRLSNDLPIADNFAEIVEHWLCMEMPMSICQNENGLATRTGKTSSVTKLISVSRAMVSLVFQGNGGFVDKQTAESRGKECAGCKFNSANSGCLSCNGAKSILRSFLRGRRTSVDNRLKSCTLCGCFNEIQIHMNKKVLAQATDSTIPPNYPNCWKRKLLED